MQLYESDDDALNIVTLSGPQVSATRNEYEPVPESEPELFFDCFIIKNVNNSERKMFVLCKVRTFCIFLISPTPYLVNRKDRYLSLTSFPNRIM